jgi:transcriptional regulator with XRE-family HTH domain
MYGKRLKEVIKKSGINQRELSKIINTPETTISGWIKQYYPPLENIEKVCNALKISLSDFFMDGKNNNYNLPPGISQEQIEFLNNFNNLPKKRQIALLEAFIKIVESE